MNLIKQFYFSAKQRSRLITKGDLTLIFFPIIVAQYKILWLQSSASDS